MIDILDNSRIIKATSFDKIEEAQRIAYDIIENLSPAAIRELGGGYQADVDKLLQNIVTETYASIFGGLEGESEMGKFNHSSIHYLDKLGETVENILTTESFVYFLINVMPEFDLNWHHVEWANIAQEYNKACVLAARGHGTSHMWTNAYPIWRAWRYNKYSKRADVGKLGKETWIYSATRNQATRLISTMKESIEENPLLREKLYPGVHGWAETTVKLKNGTKVISASMGQSTRGAHPGTIIVDDLLDESTLYSKEQREKAITYFHSVIMNMVEPGGHVFVVGTPFHNQDLYGDLKSKKGWHVREYPSIFPDGRILWERRFSYADLIEKKDTQGSVNFSRENLCRPISSDSSIFPFSILEKSKVGTGSYVMVNNIESFPIKLNRVGIGVDLAISSSVGADYTVMTVGGFDDEENLWILNVYRLHGASYGEQITKLKQLNLEFKPHIIQVESNGFQVMFADGASKEGMPVMSAATTAKSKNDLKTGLPGIALMFERGKIKIPHGDKISKDTMDLIFAEFSSITYTNNGLQATGGHDDICMSVQQLVRGLDYRSTGFIADFM